METLWQDLRYSVRMLAKNPGFTLIAVFTLALGIGANTAIFSVVNAVLIRPLPYRQIERLVWLANANRSLGVAQTFLNQADILDYREQAKSFVQIASWHAIPANLTGARTPERLDCITVTLNFFQTLGVRPMLGRDFVPEDAEEAPDGLERLIISYSLWQRQFGGDPMVIGRKIGLGTNDQTIMIIGVMPRDFQFPSRIEAFGAYQYDRADTPRGGPHNDRTIARLKPGVTVEQAQAEISSIAQHQGQLFPKTNQGWDVAVVPFREYFFGGVDTALPLMFGAVGLVLLIACANVAGLQLTRTASRQKDIAIRLALGAGRGRIVRQLLTESLMLAGAGGGLGVLLAIWSLGLVRALGPDSVPRLKEAVVDIPALGFMALTAILTGLIFGLFPALQSSRANLNEALNNARNSNTAAPKQLRFRNVTVVSQIALAVVLSVGAGLLIKSFRMLQEVNPGFQAESILTTGLSINFDAYRDQPRRIQFYQEGLERLSNLPGVESVGATSHLPFGGRMVQTYFNFIGGKAVANSDSPLADFRVVSPSFFETMRIPLKYGRAFTERDRIGTPMVYLVNEAFARIYLAAGNPIGERLDVESANLGAGEIIGVVGDVKHRELETAAIPTIYATYLQKSVFPIMNYVIRAKVAPESLTESVRRELLALDQNQVVFNVRPMTDLLSDAIGQRQFHAVLLGLFAVIAMSLTVVGIYGVVSHSVTQRKRDIAIRMALGAQAGDALNLILWHGLKLALLGVALGLAAAFALTRLMETLLFGVRPTDPLTFTVIAAMLTLVALLACWIPARRAMKVDPMIALRAE